MEKLGLPIFCRLAIYTAVFVIPFHAIAQNARLEPSGWQAFVASNNNRHVADTFLIQTFNGTPEDNWGYTINKKTELFDAKAFPIRNASEGKSLKLSPGADVIFDEIKLSTFGPNIMLLAPYAAHDLMPGENLHIFRTGKKGTFDKQYINIPYDNYTFHFQEKKEGTYRPDAFITDGGGEYYKFQFQVSDSSGHSANGFYALDTVCCKRKIPAYTLFTGNGDWLDATCWSHDPASRNRHALIRGEVTVSDHIQCDSLMLGEGSVYVAAGNHLFVQELFLNGRDVSLSVAGDIHIKDRVCYQLTLPDAGQWYFVSFPFDVYVEGIDPEFQLGDEETTAEGNYFYMKAYDGVQRSATGRAADNWKTVPVTAGNEGAPVFRRGQGYLIALDQKADRQVLQFSAKHDQLPASFGREGRIPVKASLATKGIDAEHQGWVLCGNPLPAPLPLSAIETNPALDGYVYVYDGKEFQGYPIGSKEVLPPLSAFFVKAKQDTELNIRQAGLVAKTGQPAFPLLPFQTIKEPAASSATANLNPFDVHVSFRLTEDGIEVHGLLSPASLTVIDRIGCVLVKQSLAAGSSFIPLRLPAGIYILQIQSGSNRTQYKVVRDK